jgi:multidrug efflux pump subunit AcrB
MSEQELNDLGVNFIRPQLATIQGASVPIPYGGKVRQVMVDIDSHQLMAKGLSPMDVVNAVNVQNVILPSGTAKIGRTEYNVGLNGTPSMVPMFFLTGVARYLFVPLAEAVVFALFASYFFSRTSVPTLVMYLMKKEVEKYQHPEQERSGGIFSRNGSSVVGAQAEGGLE